MLLFFFFLNNIKTKQSFGDPTQFYGVVLFFLSVTVMFLGLNLAELVYPYETIYM